MANLYIGTCSWKYPSWAGLVYSSREPANYLAEYARKYGSVEVDQWFWSLGKSGAALPRVETVAEYDRSTPDDFRFTVKCPNALTLSHFHVKKGETPEPNPRFLDQDFFMRFLESLASLVPKIGLFVFQFEYLNKEKMASKQAFTDRLWQFLDHLPADLPYAVEIRNPRWIDSAWFDMLLDQGTAPVLLQGYWMDDVAGTIDANLDRLGDTVCIRLHGEDREGMEERTGENWSQIVRPKDDELKRISASIKKTFGKGSTVYININNHYEGSAPRTIERIMPMLQPSAASPV